MVYRVGKHLFEIHLKEVWDIINILFALYDKPELFNLMHLQNLIENRYRAG